MTGIKYNIPVPYSYIEELPLITYIMQWNSYNSILVVYMEIHVIHQLMVNATLLSLTIIIS